LACPKDAMDDTYQNCRRVKLSPIYCKKVRNGLESVAPFWWLRVFISYAQHNDQYFQKQINKESKIMLLTQLCVDTLNQIKTPQGKGQFLLSYVHWGLFGQIGIEDINQNVKGACTLWINSDKEIAVCVKLIISSFIKNRKS
jgi:hypothetical protein